MGNYQQLAKSARHLRFSQSPLDHPTQGNWPHSRIIGFYPQCHRWLILWNQAGPGIYLSKLVTWFCSLACLLNTMCPYRPCPNSTNSWQAVLNAKTNTNWTGFPICFFNKWELKPIGKLCGSGKHQMNISEQKQMFLKISRYFKHSTPLARPPPSNACTRSWWQHYLLELDLFLCPETTHEEPGTGNSYWVLKVFPGHCLRPDRNATTVGSHTEEQRESFLGICVIALLLLLKISRAKGSGLHSDMKPLPAR